MGVGRRRILLSSRACRAFAGSGFGTAFILPPTQGADLQMTTLEVRNLIKQFPGSQYSAVNDISFELGEDEILTLVGPSGCGKTTTLRLIAGLERPDSGLIRLNGRIVTSDSVFVPPEQRGVGMVFQDHALFPHLTVYENVAFGLRGRKSAEVRSSVKEMLHLVGMETLSKRYPHA